MNRHSTSPELTHSLSRRCAGVAVALCAAFALTEHAAAQSLCAQPGKDGAGGTLAGVVNSYWQGNASAAAGATSLSLGGRASGGGTTNITSGDLLLVIQMQDAEINSTQTDAYGDGVAGGPASGQTAVNQSGRYEFVRATNNVGNGGGTLNLVGAGAGGGLVYAYNNANASSSRGQRRFQVVRVPQYTTATLGATLAPLQWNGRAGGVLVLDVRDDLALNNATVNASGRGFRAGGHRALTGDSGVTNSDYRSSSGDDAHGSKGEGIAGTPRWIFDGVGSTATDTGTEGYPNGSHARGAPGNAGGGGTDGDVSANQENSGGGGGGNGGAGGFGGNSWRSNLAIGGFGGAALVPDATRLFLGGGAGTGTRNNSGLSQAGSGGALVIVRARSVTGTGTLRSNGTFFNTAENDAAGGGGAGGTVVVAVLQGSLSTLTLDASGAKGGDAWTSSSDPGAFPGNRHGPGGGGGGGVIFTTVPFGTATVAGGAAGVTNQTGGNYGALPGAAGVAATIGEADVPGVASGSSCTYNTPPTNRLPAAQTMAEDATLTLSGANAITVFDPDAASAPLQVTLTATNGTMTLATTAGLSFTAGDGTADATMTFTGTQTAINTALNGLVFRPTLNFVGAASITITANDQGNTGTPIIALSDTDTLSITVTAVNDAPAVTAPVVQAMNEDTTLTFSSGNSNAITVSDVDLAAGNIDLALSVTTGVLNLATTAGLTIVSGGDGSSAVTIRGTQTAVNAALAGLRYTPPANFNGTATLSLSANDNGNTGAGGALVGTASVTINVAQVNDAPVITSNGGGATAAISVGENTTTVTTVTATDVDAGQTLTFSISGGADAARFAINPSTGVLTFVTAPNFEAPTDADGNNVYVVIVSATDNGTPVLSDTQTISVTVTNVNEPPVISSNGGGDNAAISIPENTTAVTTVQATDPESGVIAYSISGGLDAARFAINTSTGALTFLTPPNFEAPTDSNGDNVYLVQIRATDPLGAFDTQALSVTVTNLNEPPVITSNGGGDTASVSVAENTTAVTTVTATDPDAGATRTFSIAGGADGGQFTINASTGALAFVTAPNFELPTDSNGDNVYVVIVQVSDGLGGTDTQTLSVTVTNANEPPVFTSPNTATVPENTAPVMTVVARDPELGAVTYSIAGGADQARFTINTSTGALAFVAPLPNFEAPDDVGANNVYDVQVRATDAQGNATTQNIAVTVTNANEAPVITSNGGGDTASVSVAENTTAVTTVTATDPDVGQTRTFSLVGGADQARFSINASSGALAFLVAPNFEAPTDSNLDNVYVVVVQVADNGTPSLTDTQTLSVTVTNVNEPPVITSNGGGDTAAISVAENTTAVTTVTATDPEAGVVTYSLAGGADQARFSINASSGALAFLTAPNFEAPTDANLDNVYIVQVRATDPQGNVDTQTINVTVTNANEPPVISSNGGGDTASVNVAENTTAVTTVVAADPEAGAITYSIAGGADGARFSINGTSGALAFLTAPNFEAPTDADTNNVYVVVVRASDPQGNIDTQTISVTVTNVNEPPVITSNGGGDTAAISVAENTTAVTTVVAADPEAGLVAYSLVGGVDQARFSINATTGALSFVVAPNFEAPTDANLDNVYVVQVRATDPQGNIDTQTLSVTVTNANEAPVITSDGGGASASVNVAENTTAVTTVTSTDVDVGQTRTYSLVGGADQARFTIGAASGVLSFVTAPNFEAPTDADGNNVYVVVVQVADNGTPSLADTQTLNVTVTNVNEPPAITSNGGGDTASVQVSEGTTAVTTVIALDPEGGAVTYAIAGGADALRFTLNPSTGALAFITPPVFSPPGDANGDNVYEVIVRAVDAGGLADNQTINVSIDNVNEPPVITSNGGGVSANITLAENIANVTQVQANDPDGLSVTYGISGGADSVRFAINPTTGALTFVVAPNFEAPTDSNGDNVYVVIVRATDAGGLFDEQTLNVTITNVNEAPVITSNGGGATATVNVAENATAVTTVQATDPDAGQAVTYSVTGGPDQARFTINGASGALSFVTAPNFEAPSDDNGDNVYVVQVSATDPLGLADTQLISVTVTNVNEAPAFTSPATANVPENTSAVMTVTAPDPEGGAVTYSLVGGADQARFALNAGTGALSFVVPLPNFEAPADADTNNVYVVQVRATDPQGNATTQTLSVTVTNVNEAPVITSNGGGDAASVSVAENTTAVTTVTATDPDAGQTLTYAVIGGADAARFTISPSGGALSFVSAPNFEAPADQNGDNVYVVQVRVTDNGTPALSDTQTLSVTVTNVNEAPVITSNGGGDTASVSVVENTTGVTTVVAADPEGGTLAYGIVGGADAARFNLNASTGSLTFVTPPDFEAPSDANGDNVYVVQVRAADAAGNADTQTLSVTVTNANDPPVITSNGGGDTASVSVAENTTAVTTVIAVDPDVGQTLTYSITGGADATRFAMNGATGALSFVTPPNFEAPSDADGNNIYVVVVQASDGQGGTDTQTLSVTVTNANEPPVITSNGGGATAAVSVAEGTTSITRVTATDPDVGQTVTFSLAGGSDQARFSLNATTGELALNVPPNFEAPTDSDGNNTYVVVVRASDGQGGTDEQTITVTVTNVNESPANIVPAAASTNEDTALLFTGPLQVSIADEDAGTGQMRIALSVPPTAGTLTLASTAGITFQSGTQNGSAALVFTGTLAAVNASLATLRYDPAANFNGATSLTVTSDDQGNTGAGGPRSDMDTVAITVVPVNDAPVITSNGGGATANVQVDEGTTAVTTVTATDVEGQTVSYSISGGADSARFGINATTGALAFLAPPNFESPTDQNGDNVYVVTVRATDSGGAIDEQTLSVTVLNVNEAPVITSNGGGDSANVSVAENTTGVTTVVAVDQDAGQTVTYSVSGGADAARFALNPSSGALTFVTPPNFEAPTDSNGDNVYVVVVQASDAQGGVDTQTLNVTVTNVNEPPVLTSNGGGATASVNVPENTTAVTTVVAVDPEGGTVTYSLSGGADQARFTLNASTGALAFIAPPNFEAPTDSNADNVYVVQVRAADAFSSFVTQTLNVTVTNANEPPAITSNGGGPAASISLAENTAAVTTVTATDPDVGQTVTFSIGGGADGARFTINSGTGALAFVTSPNFENPLDQGGDNVYEVVVQASDGQGGVATQTLTVTISNVNEAPVITAPAGVSTPEDTTFVFTGADAISVADEDSGAGALRVTLILPPGTGTLTLGDASGVSIVSGSNGSASMTFTGALAQVNAALANLSYDPQPNTSGAVTLAIIVNDQGNTGPGGPRQVATAITIQVATQNDAPLITSDGGGSTAELFVQENTTAVTTVTATDVENDPITFAIAGGADAGRFSINPTSGVLRFVAAPDFESPADADGNNSYVVVVQANDGQGGVDTQTITVNVTNVNEPPVITSNGGGPVAQLQLAENIAAVTTMVASDPDSGQTLTWSLSGGPDAARFAIEPNTGALTFVTPPNFESPTDSDTNNEYVVIVQVSDGQGGTATQTVRVTVTNVNDAPRITAPLTASTPEDVALVFAGASRVSVTDEDAGTGAVRVTVTVPAGTLTLASTLELTFVGGSVNGTSSLDFTGTVSAVNAALDQLRFTPASNAFGDVVLSLGVNDQGNTGAGGAQSASATLTITVTPVNDAPVISSNGGGASAAVTLAENVAAVTTVVATDVDGDPIAYSIQGGADAALFTLDAQSGALRFLTAPSFEAPRDADGNNTYVVTVAASDGQGGVDTQTLTVTITDANEPPVITTNGGGPTAAVALDENTSAVTTVGATDPDVGQTLTYGIAGGPDAARFAINPVTGALTFVSAPNFEAPTDADGNNTYVVTVQVSDGQGGLATQTLTITVRNVNEAPSIAAPAAVSTPEDTPLVFQGSTRIALSDPDVGVASLRVSLTVPAGTGALSLASTNGVTFTDGTADGTASLVFEGPLSAVNAALDGLRFTPALNLTGPLTLTLAVNDLGNTGSGGPQNASGSVTIDVASVNDAPVITSNGGGDVAALSVAENTTAVTTVTATDAESDQVTYGISGGADAALFTIQPSTGVLSFAVAPNFEAPTDANGDNVYEVIVRASDAAGGADTQLVRVTVTNANEPPAITSNGGGATATVNVSEGALSVTTVTASDPDAGQTLTYTLSGGADAAAFRIDPATGALTFVSPPDFEQPTDADGNGRYEVVVQVSDGQGGLDTQSITVIVGNENDAPTLAVPGPQLVAEDTAVSFAPAFGNGLTVADADAANNAVQLTLTVANGTATLLTRAGLVFVAGDGVADAAMTLRGTLTALNAALDGLSVLPAQDFAGTVTLTLTVDDLGNSGAGGPKSATGSVPITVLPINDAPLIGKPNPQFTLERTPLVFSAARQNAITISDVDVGAGLVEVSLSVTDGRVSLASTTGLGFTVGTGTDDTTMTFRGSLADLAVALDGLTYTPDEAFTGAATLSVSVNDLGQTGAGGPLTTSAVVEITVGGSNDAPVNIVPGPQSTSEDVPVVFSAANGNAVSVSDPDAGTEPVEVSVSVTAGTLTLSGTAGLTFSLGTGTADAAMTMRGTLPDLQRALEGLTFTPVLNEGGTITLTLTTNDLGNSGAGGPQSDTDTVLITVGAQNDAPVITRPMLASTEEDTPLTFSAAAMRAITIADEDLGAAPMRVTLTASNGALSLSTLAGLTFASGDGLDDATMTFQGSLAAVNAALDGLVFTPSLDFAGDATVTVTANDQGQSGPGGPQETTESIVVSVSAVNDAPTIAAPASVSSVEEAPVVFESSNAIVVGDVDAGSAPVRVTLTATGGVVTLGTLAGVSLESGTGTADAAVTFVGALADVNAALTGLRFEPARDFDGTARVTIAVDDQGNTGAGGARTANASVDVVVAGTNDAPSIVSPPLLEGNEDVPLVFGAATGTAITVSDADVGGGVVEVTVDVQNGTLTLSGTTGLTFTTGDGSADSVMVLRGTLADINAALEGATFTPAPDYSGAASVSLRVDDLGQSGAGGPQSTTATIPITLSAVNDAPRHVLPVGASTPENTALVFSAATNNALVVGDVDAGAGELEVTLRVNRGTVTLGESLFVTLTQGTGTADVLVTFVGSLDALNEALDGLTFTPDAGASGAASITIITNDQGNTGSGGRLATTDVLAIDIGSVNDAPTLSAPAAATINEDQTLRFAAGSGNAITVADVDSGGQPEELTLRVDVGTLTLARTDGLTFVRGDGTEDAELVVRGTIDALNAALVDLTYTPPANASGTARITLTLDDLGNTGTGGPKTATAQIVVDITPLNDAPVLTAPEALTAPDGRLVRFSAALGTGLSVEDVDAATNPIELTLTATNGLLTLASIQGLTFTTGDGQDDALIVVRGTVAELNAALQGATFRPNPGFIGTASLALRADDLGNTGSGGPKTALVVVSITVCTAGTPGCFAGCETSADCVSTPGTPVCSDARCVECTSTSGTCPPAATCGEENRCVLAPPTITTPPSGSSTANTQPPITGTAPPGSTVTITLSGPTPQTLTTTAEPTGRWSVTPTPLVPGPYTATATATSSVPGGLTTTSPSSAPTTFTVLEGCANNAECSGTPDTPVCAAPTCVQCATSDDCPSGGTCTANRCNLPAPKIDQPAPNTRTTDTTPRFDGTAAPGSSVTVLVDGVPVGTTTAGPDGKWTLEPTRPISVGPHSATAVSTSTRGPLTLTGTSEPVPFTVIDGCTANVDCAATPQTPICGPTGACVQCARSADCPAGGRCSDTSVCELEAPTILEPEQDSRTTDTTPTFRGKSAPGSSVTLIVTDSSGRTLTLGPVVTDSAGNWSVTPTTPLAPGPYVAIATAKSSAGLIALESPPSTPGYFVVTTPCGQPVVCTAPTPVCVQDTCAQCASFLDCPTGASCTEGGLCVIAPPVITGPAEGAVTTATPTVTGTSAPGATVTVTITNGETPVVLTTTADPMGNWSVTVPPQTPLGPGPHTVSAVATSSASNGVTARSLPSNEVAFQVPVTSTCATNSQCPGTEAPLCESGACVQCRVAGDCPSGATCAMGSCRLPAPVITGPAPGTSTTDPTPTITGTGTPGSTITVTLTDGTTTVRVTTVVDPQGNWSVSSPVLSLGTFTVTATASLTSGGKTATSPPSNVTDVTVQQPCGASCDSAGPRPVCEVGACVECTRTSMTCGPGATCDARNRCALVAPRITEPAPGTVTTDATPQLSGTAPPGSTVVVTITRNGESITLTTTADASGNWSVEAPPLGPGTYTVSAKATTSRGGVSTESPASNTTDLTVVVRCTRDTDCGASVGTPVCATSGPKAGQCVECTSQNRTRCSGNQPVCTAANTCGCTADLDCGNATSGRVCNASTSTCGAGCSTAPNRNGCPAGLRCSTTNGSVGECREECEADSDCRAAGRTRCDVAANPNVCVECTADTHCAAGSVCDTAGSKRCVECSATRTEQCRPDAAGAACLASGRCGCTTDSDCGARNSGRICDGGSQACVPGCRGVGGNTCPDDQMCTSETEAPGVCEPARITGYGCASASDSQGPWMLLLWILAVVGFTLRKRRARS